MRSAPPSIDVSTLRHQLQSIGQDHLLRFYDDLAEPAQQSLLTQISELDLERVPSWVEQYVRNKPDFAPSETPSPAEYFPSDPESSIRSWDKAKFRRIGEEALAAGKIAAFTVAGGQGTRLGYDGPKGEYPGSAVSGKPLFQCLAEWIIASQKRWGRIIPWYIMTSPANHDRTMRFFEEMEQFGLSSEQIMFFQQGVMPSFDMTTGKILLAEPGVVATNPDGHGGSLKALAKSGALADMQSRGIEHISYVQIDNPLARVIDPVFIGLHIGADESSGEMSSKMVEKTEPGEKVGVFAQAGGKTQVIEYSDLPEELALAKRSNGSLQFNAGSIAIHMLGVDFVSRLNGSEGFGLPFHRAEKKVPCIDLETGARIEPESPNGIKLETFVFDALPLCDRSIVCETLRVEEFAPIKNADGNDSPATSRVIQTERAARWLARTGLEIPRNAGGAPECVLEISPLTAMDPEDLATCELPATIAPGVTLTI